MNRPEKLKVLIPEEVLSEQPIGKLFGYRHPSTATVNVVSWGEVPTDLPGTVEVVGKLVGTADVTSSIGLEGRFIDGCLKIFDEGLPCDIEFYSLTNDLFSRNTGILESDRLSKCSAVISGCGSVGSLVALELARAGVGRFLLIDQDTFSYANVCRHQCGISDVGRHKVEALRSRILDINPTVSVECEARTIQGLERDRYDQFCGPDSVVIGCADNRQADLYANRIACLWSTPFVSIGLWERAFAGEVFWCVPGNGPCYNCAFGGNAQVFSSRPSVNRRIYTAEEDLEKLDFEPGISVDIGWVTLVGVKIAIDFLGRSVSRGRPRVLDSLKNFTLLCNSNDVQSYGDLADIFEYPLQMTRSITIEAQPDCEHCRHVGVELERYQAEVSRAARPIACEPSPLNLERSN